MKSDTVEVVLACGSWQQAQKIADHLLGQKLVASVEFVQVQSAGVQLIMECAASHFKRVQIEVGKLHGHETFSLQTVPVRNPSDVAINGRMQVIQ
jgi:uncharacterized protein involved in tolerance to divalent cations